MRMGWFEHSDCTAEENEAWTLTVRRRRVCGILLGITSVF